MYYGPSGDEQVSGKKKIFLKFLRGSSPEKCQGQEKGSLVQLYYYTNIIWLQATAKYKGIIFVSIVPKEGDI